MNTELKTKRNEKKNTEFCLEWDSTPYEVLDLRSTLFEMFSLRINKIIGGMKFLQTMRCFIFTDSCYL